MNVLHAKSNVFKFSALCICTAAYAITGISSFVSAVAQNFLKYVFY